MCFILSAYIIQSAKSHAFCAGRFQLKDVDASHRSQGQTSPNVSVDLQVQYVPHKNSEDIQNQASTMQRVEQMNMQAPEKPQTQHDIVPAARQDLISQVSEAPVASPISFPRVVVEKRSNLDHKVVGRLHVDFKGKLHGDSLMLNRTQGVIAVLEQVSGEPRRAAGFL